MPAEPTHHGRCRWPGRPASSSATKRASSATFLADTSASSRFPLPRVSSVEDLPRRLSQCFLGCLLFSSAILLASASSAPFSAANSSSFRFNSQLPSSGLFLFSDLTSHLLSETLSFLCSHSFCLLCSKALGLLFGEALGLLFFLCCFPCQISFCSLSGRVLLLDLLNLSMRILRARQNNPSFYREALRYRLRNAGPRGETSAPRPFSLLLMTNSRRLNASSSRAALEGSVAGPSSPRKAPRRPSPACGLPTSQEVRPPYFFFSTHRSALTQPCSLPGASFCSSCSSSSCVFTSSVACQAHGQAPTCSLAAGRDGRTPLMNASPAITPFGEATQRNRNFGLKQSPRTIVLHTPHSNFSKFFASLGFVVSVSSSSSSGSSTSSKVRQGPRPTFPTSVVNSSHKSGRIRKQTQPMRFGKVLTQCPWRQRPLCRPSFLPRGRPRQDGWD